MLRATQDTKTGAPRVTDLDRFDRSAGVGPGGWSVDKSHNAALLEILSRKWRSILLLAALATAVAALVSLMVAPKYTATAQLVISDQRDGARLDNQLQMDERVDTHLTQIRSSIFMKQVIDVLRREIGEPGAVPASAKSAPSPDATPVFADRRMIVDNEPRLIGPAQTISRLRLWFGELGFGGSSIIPRTEAFQRNLRVMQERRSRLISIGYTSSNPVKSAVFANKVASLYVDFVDARQREPLQREIDALAEKVVTRGETPAAEEEPGAARPEQASDRRLRDTIEQARESAAASRRRDELLRKQQNLTPEVAIASLAFVPNVPSSHNPLLLIVPAFVAFSIGGVWLALAQSRFDRTFASAEDVSVRLGLACAGQLPALSRTPAGGIGKYVQSKPLSPYSEAIRCAAAALHLARPIRRSTSILVSSSSPREGRTWVAESLASYMAMLGHRTLLLALPSAHRASPGAAWSLPPPGRPELKSDERHARKETRRVDIPGVDYIEYAFRYDPLLAFASGEISRLLDGYRDQYECVIIDGPPALGFAEGALLTPLVDQVLFVIKWRDTRYETVENAILNLFRLDQEGLLALGKTTPVLNRTAVQP